jgi:transposase
MGVRDETLDLVRKGLTPQEIAERMGVSIRTTIPYIDQLIGERRLRRSDVFFGVPPSKREQVQWYAEGAYADLYEDLRVIERSLHRRIREALERKFGPGELGWWREIPEDVRVKLQERRERDANPERDAYAYTDLLDLSDILRKRWSEIAVDVLPKEALVNRTAVVDDLRRLNDLRKKVMHPVRYSSPSEKDFAFLNCLKPRLIREYFGT